MSSVLRRLNSSDSGECILNWPLPIGAFGMGNAYERGGDACRLS